MRNFLMLGCLLLPVAAVAQAGSAASAAVVPAGQVEGEVRDALVGAWVGVLEYRDYSEPAGSTKRVQLPTWLTIAADGDGLTLHYVYDDGPTKTVESAERWVFDGTKGTFADGDVGKPQRTSTVTGYAGLKKGRGQLVILGTGTDNDKPAESRVTLTIGRNLVTWLEEVRPAGSGEAWAYRHRYTFTRAVVPGR